MFWIYRPPRGTSKISTSSDKTGGKITITCHSCQQDFPDYESLAKHISSSKKGHQKGKRWASHYLLKTRALNLKKQPFTSNPLTQEDKENRESTKRDLSGETEYILAVCPMCKKGHREQLPIEFVESPMAWRTSKGTLIVNCSICQRD